MKVKSRNVQFTVSFETGFPAFLLYAPFIGFPLFSTFYDRRRFTRLKGCSLGIRVSRNLARIGAHPSQTLPDWVGNRMGVHGCRKYISCFVDSFFCLFSVLFVILFVFFLFWWQRWITKYNTGETGAFIRKDIHLTWSKRIACFFFNPLNTNIKIQILICYPYTFSKEVVGRICWSIN